MCQSFLVGCDELVDKSLQGAISSLEELEAKAQQLGDVSAAKIVRQYPTWLIPLLFEREKKSINICIALFDEHSRALCELFRNAKKFYNLIDCALFYAFRI